MEKEIDPEEISTKLNKWHKNNYRLYPWRVTDDPYKILIAEIMLQRTRADQVNCVYQSFISKYPSIKDLGRANLAEIQVFFKSLGLLWRAKSLQKLAKDLIEKYDGKIPRTRKELLNLPSVGTYVADALLSFAFQKKDAVVDSNICRIIGRLKGIEINDKSRFSQKIRIEVEKLVIERSSRELNLTLLDFAALVCIPRKPKCNICPINAYCNYFYSAVKTSIN